MQRWKENYLIYFNETHQLGKYRWIFLNFYELMPFLAKISQKLGFNFVKNGSNNADEIWVKISP